MVKFHMIKYYASLLLTGLFFTGCHKNQTAPSGSPIDAPAASTVSLSKEEAGLTTTTASGLGILELMVGHGAEAKPGNNLTVHYTGTLTNGQKFDSSLDRKVPFVFPLGAGQVIKGWDEGVAGMKVGGKRRLYIPSKLAYGERGAGGVIPPNADLIFEIELLKVE